jgi:hypothetical protein
VRQTPQQQAPAIRRAPQQQAPVVRRAPQQQAPLMRQAPLSRDFSIRDARRWTFAGRNYSIWRGGSYRVWRANRWRTFIAPSALSAIMLGFSFYYPYAYIDIPVDYCQGWTADGCHLQWTAVQTYEGGVDFICVAYCPWR